MSHYCDICGRREAVKDIDGYETCVPCFRAFAFGFGEERIALMGRMEAC